MPSLAMSVMASRASITSMVTAVTEIASVEPFISVAGTAMVGSGTIVAAPMAVKCSPQIASASNPGAIHTALRRSSPCQASSAADANPTPIAMEASARPRSQARVPGMTRARIPVKCMRPMPPPMTAPPAAAIARPPSVEIEKPATAATAAISSEAIVSTGS